MAHPHFLAKSDYSGLEEIFDDQHDERRIIRCLNNSDVTGLKSMLIGTNLDVTRIVDENGFTLVHLAAYVNSERCLHVLLEHFKERNNHCCLFSDDSQDFDRPQTSFDPARLKEWVNTATLPSAEASKEFNFA